jgi:hypothetical protein
MRRIPMSFYTLKHYNPSPSILKSSEGQQYTEVDTDGYYGPKFTGAVSVIPQIGAKKVIKMDSFVESSTETEWASIGLGIHFALEKNQSLIALSNDNLGVIRSIIYKTPLKHEYAFYWYNEIQNLVKETCSTKIRWIPREMNRAGKGPNYSEIYKINENYLHNKKNKKYLFYNYHYNSDDERR